MAVHISNRCSPEIPTSIFGEPTNNGIIHSLVQGFESEVAIKKDFKRIGVELKEMPRKLVLRKAEVSFNCHNTPNFKNFRNLLGNNPRHREVLQHRKGNNKIKGSRLKVIRKPVRITYDINILTLQDIEAGISTPREMALPQ